jgi:hypothetical protein
MTTPLPIHTLYDRQCHLVAYHATHQRYFPFTSGCQNLSIEALLGEGIRSFWLPISFKRTSTAWIPYVSTHKSPKPKLLDPSSDTLSSVLDVFRSAVSSLLFSNVTITLFLDIHTSFVADRHHHIDSIHGWYESLSRCLQPSYSSAQPSTPAVQFVSFVNLPPAEEFEVKYGLISMYRYCVQTNRDFEACADMDAQLAPFPAHSQSSPFSSFDSIPTNITSLDPSHTIGPMMIVHHYMRSKEHTKTANSYACIMNRIDLIYGRHQQWPSFLVVKFVDVGQTREALRAINQRWRGHSATHADSMIPRSTTNAAGLMLLAKNGEMEAEDMRWRSLPDLQKNANHNRHKVAGGRPARGDDTDDDLSSEDFDLDADEEADDFEEAAVEMKPESRMHLELWLSQLVLAAAADEV